ncbi:MAG TPA: aldo/keto reductase [Acidobacteriota bacterium]|nr:aldo/keto reductase [Acidobacteriota bacterium]
MTFNEPAVLGRTGLKVGRLGIASGYGAPAAAVEEAFERGSNYFTWGTLIKGYAPGMREALKNIAAKGGRDKLVLAAVTYAHSNSLSERFLRRGLKSAGLDHADVLVLGYFSRKVPRRLIDGALKMKEMGLARFIGVSSHDRKLLGKLGAEGTFDVLHLRYSAAHPGAERDIFPLLPKETEKRAGTVAFTATRWGQLLKAKKMPPGEKPLTAAECYRFVLSNPAVDVCMSGAKTIEQMRENLAVFDSGPLSVDEMARARRIGDFLHGPKRR